MRYALVMSFGALLACVSFASADIMTWSCEGDAATNCVETGWVYDSATQNLTIAGQQFCGPGHMATCFTTDTTADPTITTTNQVANDTSFAWTGYNITLTVDTPASQPLSAGASISNVIVTSPGGWSWSPVGTELLTYNGLNSYNQNEYVGVIDLQGGPAVGNGGTLDFSYTLTFAGATSYETIQAMSPVPEPSTLALLASALLGLCVVWNRRRG